MCYKNKSVLFYSIIRKTKPLEIRIAKRFFKGFLWRRWRDSNSRAGFPTYALSRGASSPTWVHLRVVTLNIVYSVLLPKRKDGGEGGIRTHGSLESPVFKTGSLNRSDTSPNNRTTATLLLYHTVFLKSTLNIPYWANRIFILWKQLPLPPLNREEGILF